MAVDEEQYDEVDYGIDPTRGSFETSPKSSSQPQQQHQPKT